MRSAQIFPLLLFAASLAAPASAQSLYLSCMGSGAAAKESSSDVQMSDGKGETSWGSVTSTRDLAFEDEVKIEIVGGEGRIRMPRAMLPDIRGGKDGWFGIARMRFGESEITGKAEVSLFNSPNLRIDRVSGMLSINGKAGTFTARCRSYDPLLVQRAF